MEVTSPTSNAYPLHEQAESSVSKRVEKLIRRRIATGPPTSNAYPLHEQAESRVSATVKIRDIDATMNKEVGPKFEKLKLESVLRGFQGIGEKLTPIPVIPQLRNKRIHYKVENGYHRHKISELCGLQEIPVSYNQSEYKGVVEDLERQLSAPQPSEQKYVPPDRRQLLLSSLTLV